MCNHKWKIIASYRHPYLMSRTVVCKECTLCNVKIITNKFTPSGIFTFASAFFKPKTYKKTISKVK